MMLQLDTDDFLTGKQPVLNTKLRECGLCNNPYPYGCEQCNLSLTCGASAPDPTEIKIFIGSGEDVCL